MNFEQFASAHGLIVNHIDFGKWVRTQTTDKPGHKNGAYKHMGDVAFVQNHATMPEVACWFPDKESEIKIDRAEIERIQRNANRQIENNRKEAAQKAAGIVRNAKHEQHAYLDSKGFPEALGRVYYHDETTNLLVSPRRVGSHVVGCQLIGTDGSKKFLFGQRCSGAEFVIDGRGIDVWCEGYATGLSISTVMAAIKVRCCIHICFSAGNMEAMAKSAGRGFVVADNDISGTGEKAAKATGLNYFLPPDLGSDFNDYHKGAGTFLAGQALRRFMLER